MYPNSSNTCQPDENIELNQQFYIHPQTYLILRISARLQERGPHANHFAFGDIGKVSQDFPHPDHLSHPFFVPFILQPCLEPMEQVKNVSSRETFHLRDSFGANLIPFARQLLDHLVIAVLMRDVEGALDGAPIGIESFAIEHLLVVVIILQIDGSIEGEQNHLRSLLPTEKPSIKWK